MLGELIALFKQLWDADERPEARRFTIGCFAIAVVALLAVSIYFGITW